MMLWRPPAWVADVMQLTPMGDGFKAILMGLAGVHLAAAWVGETRVFPAVAKGLGAVLKNLSGSGGKQGKLWKRLEREMRA